jgi:hypothetical protein
MENTVSKSKTSTTIRQSVKSGIISKKPKTRTKKNNPTDKIFDLIGDKGGQFKKVFEMMDVAEKAIAEKRKEYPDYDGKINNAFRFLMPSDIFHRFSANDMLYRKHCEEIIDRILFSPKLLKYGTDAEVLATLSLASLVAPLDSDHANVYFLLFRKLFREQYERLKYTVGGNLVSYESYPGRAKEITTQLKKKLITERNCCGDKKDQLSLF